MFHTGYPEEIADCPPIYASTMKLLKSLPPSVKLFARIVAVEEPVDDPDGPYFQWSRYGERRDTVFPIQDLRALQQVRKPSVIIGVEKNVLGEPEKAFRSTLLLNNVRGFMWDRSAYLGWYKRDIWEIMEEMVSRRDI